MWHLPTGRVIGLDDVEVVPCSMARCQVASIFSCFAYCPETGRSIRAFLCERHSTAMLRCLPTRCGTDTDQSVGGMSPHQVIWRHDMPYGSAR